MNNYPVRVLSFYYRVTEYYNYDSDYKHIAIKTTSRYCKYKISYKVSDFQIQY